MQLSWIKKSSEQPSVDVIVRGEGELTLLELTQKIANQESLSNVEGLTFRKDGQIQQNAITSLHPKP